METLSEDLTHVARGYQVCRGWLKDRGPRKARPARVLTEDEVDHYHHGAWRDAVATKPRRSRSNLPTWPSGVGPFRRPCR